MRTFCDPAKPVHFIRSSQNGMNRVSVTIPSDVKTYQDENVSYFCTKKGDRKYISLNIRLSNIFLNMLLKIINHYNNPMMFDSMADAGPVSAALWMMKEFKWGKKDVPVNAYIMAPAGGIGLAILTGIIKPSWNVTVILPTQSMDISLLNPVFLKAFQNLKYRSIEELLTEIKSSSLDDQNSILIGVGYCDSRLADIWSILPPKKVLIGVSRYRHPIDTQPDIFFVDYGVLSPHNRIEIWNPSGIPIKKFLMGYIHNLAVRRGIPPSAPPPTSAKTYYRHIQSAFNKYKYRRFCQRSRNIYQHVFCTADEVGKYRDTEMVCKKISAGLHVSLNIKTSSKTIEYVYNDIICKKGVPFKVFREFKELSEASPAIWISLQFDVSLFKKIRCYVIGEGKRPQISLPLAVSTSWDIISIDPIKDKYTVPEPLEDSFKKICFISDYDDKVDISDHTKYDLVIIVGVHSHNNMANFYDSIKVPKILIAIPCCVPIDMKPPDFQVTDYSIMSGGNTIKVWNPDNISITEDLKDYLYGHKISDTHTRPYKHQHMGTQIDLEWKRKSP